MIRASPRCHERWVLDHKPALDYAPLAARAWRPAIPPLCAWSPHMHHAAEPPPARDLFRHMAAAWRFHAQRILGRRRHRSCAPRGWMDAHPPGRRIVSFFGRVNDRPRGENSAFAAIHDAPRCSHALEIPAPAHRGPQKGAWRIHDAQLACRLGTRAGWPSRFVTLCRPAKTAPASGGFTSSPGLTRLWEVSLP